MGMDLKTFISTSIVSIVEGVKEAQEQSAQHGAHVNPGGLTRPSKNIADNSLWDHSTNNFARMVSFDIAVTVEEGTATNARIGVVAGLLGATAGGASQNKELAVSRIKFEVPVLLPASQAPETAKPPKISRPVRYGSLGIK
jgi:hypothetical protein